MKILSKKCELSVFWECLRSAEQALLLLDFDGTLSPFVLDPEKARPYPGVGTLLENIKSFCRTRLVIVSGREITSLEGCLEMSPAPELWGCHGWQRQSVGGRMFQYRLPHTAETLLRQAELLAEDAGYSLSLERKQVSLALHWRGVDEERVEHIQALLGEQWRKLTLNGDLRLHGFDGGMELRCSEVDKGTAVTRLLNEVEQGAAVAYLGDDLTDEDAFKVLGNRGMKVLVRPQLRETAADLWLQPPEELLWFLQQWIDCRGGDVSGSS
jgi:trehalose 6-phosphate phosphatase